jgi:hypothetical protein
MGRHDHICEKPAKSTPGQLAHHGSGIESDRPAKLDQLNHVDPALAGFHVRDL